ncbi:hypothetical protein ACNOYE_33295 [Nannocystaceae bacterium ST9]
MTQLDERTRRALLAADDPPRGMQDRIYRAIVVGGGPPAGGEGEPSGGAGLDLPLASGGGFEFAFAAKVVGATIGLTSSGLVVLALAGAGIRAIDRPEPAHVAVEARTHDEPSAASTSEPPRPPTQEDATTIVAVEPSSAGDDEPVATTTIRTPSEPAASGSTLEAELALIEAARAATDPADILAALERHRDEFPSGVLADEREVMRIEALCGLGRIADAERVAAAFVAAKPSHPLRSRVEPACPK